MPLISRMLSFSKNIFRRRQVEKDMHDELMAYVDELTERNIRDGMTVEAARDSAIHELGGIDALKRRVRQQHIGRGVLRKAAVFACMAMLFFAAGAGGTVELIRWRNPDWLAKHLNNDRPGTQSSISKKQYIVPVRVARNNLVAYTDEEPQISPVEGKVSEKDTGNPIANVEVRLEPWPQSPRFTTTDDSGHFSFPHALTGDYALVVGSKDVEIPLSTGKKQNTLTVLENAAYSASVTTPDGKPVEGTAMKIHRNGTLFKKTGKISEPTTQDLRVFQYSSGKIDVGIPTRTTPNQAGEIRGRTSDPQE